MAGERAPKAHRGWLGIVMNERPGGKVFIKQVMRASPAKKSGLRSGDQLLRINQTPVHSARETVQAVGQHPAGTTVRVTLQRGSVQHVRNVKLERFPSGEALLRMQLVGRPAPALQALRTSMGTRGPTMADYEGKVRVLDFWASWCVACRATSNHINDWHRRFAPNGLKVLAIAAEPSENVARGARRFGIQYPTFADPTMATSAAYHVQELPSLVVIDKKGIVRDVTTGHDPRRMRQLRALLQRLLNQPAQPQ